MAILAIAILLLCLGSVSAVDEYQLNSTLETVNDNSQNENIVIDEINENNADDIDVNSVSVESEKNGENLLKATNDDVLGADPTLTPISGYKMVGDVITAQKDVPIYIQMSGDYPSSYSAPSSTATVYIRESQYTYDNLLSPTTYGLATSGEGTPLTFSTAGSYTFLFKVATYNYDIYSSFITVNVVDSLVDETQTSISIDPTTVVPNNLITITPTVTKKGTTDAVTEGVVKFFYGDRTEMGEIDLSSQTSFEYSSGFADEGTYDIYAVYQANDKYGESTSDAVSVLVSQDTSKTPVTVTIALSKTGVAPGETITITPSVKNNNGEDVTGVVDLYDGNDNLIASGVAIGSSYSYAVSETSGEYQVYAKYLGNDDLAYAPGTSAKYDYKVKKQVQITLKASANEVTPSSYGGTRVTFTISCSETLPALKLYLNDEEFSTVSAGSTSTSISFDSSDAGSNTVYVYLAEDEDFVEATSNTETVKVYTTVSVTPSITLNQSSVVEGEKLLVTVTASNNAPGTITIYSDSSYQNEIATLPVGESYEYTVPVTEGSSSYYTGYLYVYYNGYDDGYTRYTHYAYASGSKSFTVLRQNNAVLTGNGKTGDVEIDFGGSVILHIDLDYWKQSSQYSSYNTVYVSNVVIYLDGEEFDSFEVNRESSGYYDYTYSIADYEITFGDDGDEGTHTIYAYYKGSNEYDAYYAPATSNELTVNVKPSTVATTTTLTASNTTPKYGDKITITPKVNDGEVTSGTITYYIGETAISEALSLNTRFEYTVDGVTPVTITGKFSGEGYEASEGSVEIKPVKADNNIVVTATTVDYPNKVNIKVTADVEDTYTVTVGGKTVDVVANSEAGVDYQLAASDDDYVATVADWTNDYYEPKVTPATFKVNKGSNTVSVTAEEVVLPNGVVTVYVTADVIGNYTVVLNDGTEIPVVVSEANVAASATSDKKLTAGTYTATTSFADNENYTVTITPGEFEVKKSPNTAKVTVTSETYPDSVTITVTSNVEGDYEVNVNGTKITVNIAEGETSGSTTYKFGAENYKAIITDVPESADYETVTEDDTFTVSKGTNAPVIVIDENNYLPGEVTVKVQDGVKGDYVISIDGETVNVEVDDTGIGENNIALVAKDGYVATLTLDNANYTTTAEEVTFNVKKSDIALTIVVNNVLNGNTVVGRITTNVSGTYTVEIEGMEAFTEYFTVGENGFSTSYVPALRVEEYSASISIDASPNYNAKSASTTFRVVQNEVQLSVVSDKGSYDYGDEVKLNVDITEGASGKVTFTYEDGSIAGEIEDVSTQKEISLGVLAADSYKLTASYEGNTQFEGKTFKNIEFIVSQGSNTINVAADKQSYDYGDAITVTVEADVKDTYTIKIDETHSVDVEAATESEGKFVGSAVLPWNLDASEEEYSATSIWENANYSATNSAAVFKVNKKENAVTVNVAEVEYGKPVNVELSNAVEGTYTVNINGKPVTVEVDSTGSGSATESIDLAVGKDYSATVSFDNGNYLTTGETAFDVVPALNEITVTVNPTDVVYGGEITVTVEASVPDVYEVDVAGKIVKVNVDGNSNSNTTNVNVDVGTDYEAKVAWTNANYTAKIQNATFNVIKAVNNVEITISSVEYSSEITVNVKADKAGTYTVKLDDAHSVDVVVSADGETGATTDKVDLAVSNYQATTSFDDDNYDTQVTGGEFEITPAKNTVKITVESPINYGDDVTVTVEASVADTYTVTIGGKTVDVKVEDASKAVTAKLDLAASETAYVATTSWENENYTLELTEGSLTVNPKTNKVTVEVADVTLPDEVTVNVTADVAGTYRVYFNETAYVDVVVEANVKKSVTHLLAEGSYNPSVDAQFENANYTMDSTITESFTVNPEEISDDLIRILDYDYQANSTITIVSDDNVTIRIAYYLEEPSGSYYYGQEVRLNIGDQMKSVTPVYNQWSGFTYEINETKDLTVSARYIALNLMGEDIDVTSNKITYHIIINRPEPVENNISIESKEVNYGTKANLTVTGTDGEYTVTVDKDYDVTVQNGTGYVIVDVLAGNKTYEVKIVSKTNSSLNNASTLTVKPISPELTISATNVAPTYGESITISADKNASANGIVKFYEGDKEVNVADVILSGGKHTITAKYVADGNFTYDSAEIEINVKEAVNELELEITSPTYPENVTITLKATVPGDYEVIIAGNPYTVTVADNGVGTKSIRLIPNNEYTATVDYKGNGNYSDNTATYTFKVFGNTIGLNATASETVAIGQNVELNSSSKISEATGKVTYSFDDGTEDVIAEIGEIVTYAPKTVGKHTITVTYDDGIFDPETVTLTVVVNKKQNNIKVEVEGSTYPENVTVKVTADVEGEYTIDINGSTYTVTANGEGKSIKLDAGSYYANVTYSDDEYDGISTNATFVVEKGTNNVKVEVSSVELPNKVVAYITADVAGTYRIYFDDDNYVDVEVKSNEKTAAEEYDLASGNYTTKVVFADDNYTNNVENADFEVSKVDSEFKLNLTTVEFTVNDEVVIKFTLPSDASGKVTFRYANGTIAGEKEVGSGILGAAFEVHKLLAADTTEYQISLGKLPKGEYALTAEYSGDEVYKDASETVNFNVIGISDVVLRIRDATYTDNATITINGKDNVSITLEYYFTKPSETLISPQIDGYINGEHLTGFGLYEFEKVVSGSYATFGTLTNISESCELEIYLVFTSQSMGFFGTAYNVESNHIKYIINIESEVESNLTVEADFVDDLTNATVVVKSNVPGEYIVSVNGSDYTVTVGDSGVNSTTVKVLSAGEYTVTVTAKDNASFTNNTQLVVSDSAVPVPDSLIVEAVGASYPANATVVVKTNKAGDYVVTVNSKDYLVNVDGEATIVLDVLPVDEYDVVVKAKDNASFTNNTKLTISKGTNNVKVEVSDVTLPSNVTVKVTSDVAGTYTIKFDDVHSVTVTVAADGGSASEEISLSEGTYTPSLVGFVDDNYDAFVDASSFTVSPEVISDVVLTIRDATYTDNATIVINSKDNVSITLEYYFTKPDETLISPEISGYINGEHLAGFGLYEFEKVVSGSYATFGTLSNITESCELDIYVVFTSQQMSIFGNAYNVSSNHIKYIINIESEVESNLTVEADSVDDLTNATVVVRSNVPGEYIVSVNGSDYTVTVGDSGVNSTSVKVLSAGEYTVTVTAKDNASFTNNTKLIVIDSTVPVPDSLIVEAVGASYPANATVVVKTNKAGDYVVTVNGKDYIVSVDGEAAVTLDVLPVDEYEVTVKANDNASFTNNTKLTISKGTNNVKVEVSDVTLPSNVTVKVTADVAGTYTIKFDDVHSVTVTVAADGGSVYESVALDEGTYTPSLVGYVDNNYDVVVDASSFTVSPEVISDVVLIIRDAIYTNNATIVINSKDNVSITLQYYFTKPDETLISPEISGYINGEHLAGFGLYEFEKVVSGSYATFGTLSNITESCELDIYVVFTSQQMSIFGTAYNVTSNHIKYIINIEENETSSLSVEADSVDDLTNATVVVRSNVVGEYVVSVNGSDYTVTVGDSGVNSTTVKVLSAGEYTVTVTAKDNASFTNNTKLIVIDSTVPVPDSLTVEAVGASYPANATVVVKTNKAGDYVVTVNGKDYIVSVEGEVAVTLDVLPVDEYEVTVKANDNASFTNNTKLIIEKGTNNVKVEVSDVTLPSNVTVKVTADVAGTYTIKLDGTHEVTVTVVADGGSASESVALADGTYTPSIVGYADDNYDAVVDASSFTVSPEVISDVVLIIRDATYTDNATIVINSKDNVSITLQYYFTKPDEILLSPEISGYINGEHLVGFGLYEFEKVVSGSYATFGTLSNITESCELDIYVVFTSEQMGIFGTAYNVTSNHIKYIINIEENETSSLSVEADSVDDLTNATVVVRSNVPGEYIVSVNGSDYTVTVGDSGVNSTIIKVLPAGEYTVSVAAKDNASFTNNTQLVVRDSSVPVPDSLTVEAVGASYPANASVVVKTNKAGDYIVTVNGKDYSVAVDGEATVTLDVLPADEYDVTVKAKDNASFTNSTKLTIAKGTNNVKVEVSDVTLPSNVTVKVTADVAGNYTIKLDGTHEVTVTVAADGGSASEEISLAEGSYTPSLAGYADDNYDAVVDANSFTVSPEVISDVVLRIRDATYTNNATIVINSKDNVSITLQYYFTKPDEILISPEISGYINGEHLTGFGLYEFEKVVSGSYATFGTLSNITESCELDIYVVFTSEQMSIFGTAYNVTSNHIKYIINIEENETSSLSVEADSVDDLTNATVVVRSNVPGEYIVSVNGSDYTVTVGDGGVNSTTVKVLPAGEYSVTVTAKDNASFTNNTQLVISHSGVPIVNNLTVEADSVDDFTNPTVVVKSNVAGEYVVSVNGSDYTVTVGDSGVNSTVVKILPSGNHTVIVTSKTNSSLINSTILIVTKHKEDEKGIIVIDVADKSDIGVKVDIPGANGNVSIIVDGKETIVPLSDGKLDYSVGDLGAGNHSVVVVYLGDDAHDADYACESFSIDEKPAPEPVSSEVDITVPSDVKTGDGAVVGIKISNATGNVSVIIDGKETTVALDENGSASVPISNVGAGDHSVVVIYPGDESHAPTHSASSFTVPDDSVPDKEQTNATITTPVDFKVGDDANVTVDVPGATGNVSVIVDGVEKVVPLVNGKAIVPIENISAGEHSVVVVYDGDDTYAPFHKATSFNAEVLESKFENLTVNEKSIEGVLVNSLGDIIPNETIVYKVNGVEAKVITDEKGHFSFNVTYPATVEIVYGGKSFILPYTMTITLNDFATQRQATSILAEDFSQYACDFYEGERGENFTFRLVDEKGNPISNRTVFIGYNGVTYNRTTDANGFAAVQINLKSSGLYTFVVVFLGDEEYNASMAVHKITINKKTTSISASAKTFKATVKTKKYTVTLKTIKGASIDGKTYLAAGKKVTLTVNGKTYSAKTNSKGQVTFKITKLNKKGKFTAKISFAGDSTYKSANKSVKLTIK